MQNLKAVKIVENLYILSKTRFIRKTFQKSQDLRQSKSKLFIRKISGKIVNNFENYARKNSSKLKSQNQRFYITWFFFSFDSFHLTRKTTSLKNFGFVDVFQNLHSRRPDSAFYSSQCWCWLRQRRSHFWMCTNFKSWKQARAGPSAKCQWSPVRVSKIILFYVKHTLQKTSFRSIAGIAAELARSPSAAPSV